MSLYNKIRDYLFRPEKPISSEDLPLSESAWVQSQLFSVGDFVQFNPDSLIRRQGFGVYKRMMLDEQVKAVVKFKRDAITGRDHHFEISEGSELSDDEKKKRIALYVAIVKKMEKPKFFDALNGIMSSLYNGFSVTEKTFKQIEHDGKTWWGVKRLRLKPYDTFFFKTDEVGNLTEVKQRIDDMSTTQTWTSEQWKNDFIHFVQNPDVDEYYGQSELREAYRPWFSKDNLWKYRMIYMERHAGGFKWIKPTGDKILQAGTKEFASLQDILSRTQVGGSMILPSNVEFNVEWPQQNVDFKNAIMDADLGIAKALLVPNLLGVTPEVGIGSMARAETQFTAFLWTLNADARRLEEALNENVFGPLGEVNFGDDDWPMFRLAPMTDDQIVVMLKLWKELVTASAVKASESDEAHVRKLMKFPERSEDEEEPPAITGPEIDPDTGLPVPAPDGGEGQPTGPPETVSGREGTVTVPNRAFTRAAKRVDFQRIANDAEKLVSVGTERLTEVVDAMMRVQLDRFEELGTITAEDDANADPISAQAVKLDKNLSSKAQRVIRAELRRSWDLGMREADSEVEKAGGKPSFMGSSQRARRFIEESFFDTRSFAAVGNLTADLRSIVRNVMLQGAKKGSTSAVMQRELTEQLASRGLVSRELVRSVIGAVPKGIRVTNARLETLMRTNDFEALNEARFTAFTDPSLGGFIEALEYSAILDSVMTAVCRHVDGRVYLANDEVWVGPTSWRPPNHFNCRSLLIPVTQDDTFEESEFPAILPQEGFQ